jgi:twitching motility two-component system response regulator PilH
MSQTILVVDDSPTERFFLADLLSKKGYTVITAENGDQALEKAKLEKPFAVVMDVVMPGLSGYQATRALAKDPDTSHIPVILCTSKSNETDRIWGMRQGARDYVTKPIKAEELLAKIADLVVAKAVN